MEAVDEDEGGEAAVSYSVPADSLFSIGERNGSLTTKQALDFEKTQVYTLMGQSRQKCTSVSP